LLNCLKYFYLIEFNYFDVFLQILQNTLEWLNEWELRVINNKIKPEHFLTNNTAEGLRVTLTSILEICTYLKDKYGIRYILTGKNNQEALEVRKIQYLKL